MTTLETILTAAVSLLTCSNIIQIFYIRATQKKLNAEAMGTTDNVLYKRIAYLDERITKLEDLACFDKSCKNRI